MLKLQNKGKNLQNYYEAINIETTSIKKMRAYYITEYGIPLLNPYVTKNHVK